ncbi:uncharacterized protein LOC129317598 [Prosopis cineraria]|uniref:uncharacterized protein LOC129317598 n=1 Tax=Prosopis cineraria TaxID=364024 RepID=UPI002410182D|nr:uncharacterized protein LOC129317598 [Prosopis cineraria]
MLNFMTARLFVSRTCITRNRVGFLHLNASHIFNSCYSVVKSFESAHLKHKQEGNESFTVSYLVNSCGLSCKAAIQASGKITLREPDKPNLVLILFRSNGLSETQISIKNWLNLLLANPEMIILPKMRFFLSIGFSSSEIPELTSSSPAVLSRSLEKFLIPFYEATKSVSNYDGIVLTAIKHSSSKFHTCHVQDLVANLKVLREHGVPESSVSMMLTKFTGAASMKHAKFVEYAEFAVELESNL